MSRSFISFPVYSFPIKTSLQHCACSHPSGSSHPSCWSDHLLPDVDKQDSHHFECYLVSRLPQVLLLHCVSLHPRWLHQCHPTCRQWHLPHSDLPPIWHHLQDWGGGCEEGRWSRRTEGKGHGELHYWGWGEFIECAIIHSGDGLVTHYLCMHTYTYTVCTLIYTFLHLYQ